ncbi:hypothetical protein N7533_010030 [Penicillium manginii]|uniref:uncharacterized protein n=1 Tax=Penicillium manginii TaxID=203109 RepID=UPI0025490CDE|nr:uncharacterized protein N7533_010030 [Penicillium manginii]KAJ5742928.1 hypothetical protein N7533_010030 [Penicillium manginii]
MRLIQLPLVLLLSSFVSAAAIPSSPHSVVTPEWSSPETASSPSLDDANSGHLAKRRPYYFPETVPDEEEIAARLSALREAGYLPDTQTLQGHDQKSIGTPDAAIDMDPSSARPSPTQEPPLRAIRTRHSTLQLGRYHSWSISSRLVLCLRLRCCLYRDCDQGTKR